MPKRSSEPQRVVLDTQVFVAAGFNCDSHSAQIVDAVRRGELRLVWNDATRNEACAVLRRIPPLSWKHIAPLFREQDRHETALDMGFCFVIPDPADRPFAALARSAGAILVSSDEHLIGVRGQLAPLVICSPREFLNIVSRTAE